MNRQNASSNLVPMGELSIILHIEVVRHWKLLHLFLSLPNKFHLYAYNIDLGAEQLLTINMICIFKRRFNKLLDASKVVFFFSPSFWWKQTQIHSAAGRGREPGGVSCLTEERAIRRQPIRSARRRFQHMCSRGPAHIASSQISPRPWSSSTHRPRSCHSRNAAKMRFCRRDFVLDMCVYNFDRTEESRDCWKLQFDF
jgi:hypothetical protein